MQRGRGGGRDGIFGSGGPFGGSPFGGFGGGGPFGGSPFGGFGGFGHPGGPFSSLFDDPFFTQHERMFCNSMFGPGIFGESFFRPSGAFLQNHLEAANNAFLQQHPVVPTSNQRGPVITELNSDDEEEKEEEEVPKAESKEVRDNPRKHLRSSKEPYVVLHPDEETDERNDRRTQFRTDFNRGNTFQPQAQMYSFSSSSVTYGGPNGAYYTSSKTRRTGGDGVTIEESKEADTTTGKATHNVSRGIGNRGHSITRNLDSDGRVNTMQTLHNLNEDDLPRFERAWDGSARKNLPGWNREISMLDGGGSRQNGQSSTSRRALPSSQQLPHTRMGSRAQSSSFDKASK